MAESPLHPQLDPLMIYSDQQSKKQRENQIRNTILTYKKKLTGIVVVLSDIFLGSCFSDVGLLLSTGLLLENFRSGCGIHFRLKFNNGVLGLAVRFASEFKFI